MKVEKSSILLQFLPGLEHTCLIVVLVDMTDIYDNRIMHTKSIVLRILSVKI